MREGSKREQALWAFIVFGTLLAALSGAMAGCGGGNNAPTSAAQPQQRSNRGYAKATLRPLDGEKASGTAVFIKQSGRYTLKVVVKGLDPTHGQSQYGLWQLQSPQDRVALKTPDDMVALATYRVGGSGRLSTELEPTPKASAALEMGRLTHFLITKIESPEGLAESIVDFDETGRPPDLGAPVAEGAFSGSLVGAAEPR